MRAMSSPTRNIRTRRRSRSAAPVAAMADMRDATSGEHVAGHWFLGGLALLWLWVSERGRLSTWQRRGGWWAYIAHFRWPFALHVIIFVFLRLSIPILSLINFYSGVL